MTDLKEIKLRLYDVQRTIQCYVFAANKDEACEVAGDAWRADGFPDEASSDWNDDGDDYHVALVSSSADSLYSIAGCAYHSHKYAFPDSEEDIGETREVTAFPANDGLVLARKQYERAQEELKRARNMLIEMQESDDQRRGEISPKAGRKAT